MNAQREAVRALSIAEPRESLGDLLGDLMLQSSDLVKGEVALAKAELREQTRRYSSAALIIAIGAAFGLLAAMAFLAAGIIALSTYTGLVMSGVICGATLAAVAAILMMLGRGNFKRHSPRLN